MNSMFTVTYREKPLDIHYSPNDPYRVLLPVKNLEEAEFMLPLAEAIVQEQDGQLLILYDIHIAENEERCKFAAKASFDREALRDLIDRTTGITAQIKTRVRVVSSTWEGIWETVVEEQISLLLYALASPALTDPVVKDSDGEHLISPPCSVVMVQPPSMQILSGVWEDVEQILIPVRGDPGSTLTLRIGHALAQRIDANISILHVSSPEAGKENLRFYEEFSSAFPGLEHVNRFLTAKGNLSQSVLKEIHKHQVVVMGAPTNESLGVSDLSWVEENLPRCGVPIILVREAQLPIGMDGIQGKSKLQKVDRPVAVVVDKWFAENTYHSCEFEDLHRLVRIKQEQNLTISLGLPALNEQATVGHIIRTVKSSLMEAAPLLDEIVLIDSGSVDRTRQIAEDLDIPVYAHQEILSQYGTYHGKGEALWKSLYVLQGDIVAWIDTDIRNIHPRFVYGILGPLLCAPRIQYVKGFYQRPLKQGDKLVAGGGGRVTELTARPYINLFFPELSGLIQPLSGEYAGRRAVLEQLPFFTGYGVETGLLIDILYKFGLKSIAQVDLLERIHRNQGLGALSKMAFAIMQVVHNRLGLRHNVRLLDKANLTMNKIVYGPRNYYLQPEEICEHERPPMISIPEYCQAADHMLGLVSAARTMRPQPTSPTGSTHRVVAFKNSFEIPNRFSA